ncbi:transposase [Desulfococcus multivorans]|uniref:transposase n=1 Tax=Desulfococcus multivorans TaxID=897 RepID=UPI0003F7FBB8|nr:transposase [Desulfococcus multivorans]
MNHIRDYIRNNPAQWEMDKLHPDQPEFCDDRRDGSRTAPTGKRKPIGRLIGAFKTVSTKRINELRHTPGTKLWQRNYWEHIIRDESELNHIRDYIRNNPAQWEMDKLHSDQPEFGINCRGGSRTAPMQVREPATEYATETWMV